MAKRIQELEENLNPLDITVLATEKDGDLQEPSLKLPLSSLGDFLAERTETLTNKLISGNDNTITDIPNSATTATSNDTAEAIVSRDLNGDFSAGTISADLDGTASYVTNATLTTALTVDTGAVSIYGNADNTSSLTLGSGSSSLSGNALLSSDLYVNTGNVEIIGNIDNTSVLTLGSGSSSISGTNTGDTLYKVGFFTRDMTAATGSVAYTGVGFQPKLILFRWGIVGLNLVSSGWGFSDSITSEFTAYNTTSGFISMTTSACIWGYVDASNSQSATLGSLDSDGFTLSWVKNDSPTGTLRIHYVAMR